jgi:hypothetical protein
VMILKVLAKSFLWTVVGVGVVAAVLFIFMTLVVPFLQWLADDMLRALVALFLIVFLIVTSNMFSEELGNE